MFKTHLCYWLAFCQMLKSWARLQRWRWALRLVIRGLFCFREPDRLKTELRELRKLWPGPWTICTNSSQFNLSTQSLCFSFLVLFFPQSISKTALFSLLNNIYAIVASLVQSLIFSLIAKITQCCLCHALPDSMKFKNTSSNGQFQGFWENFRFFYSYSWIVGLKPVHFGCWSFPFLQQHFSPLFSWVMCHRF